jgi:hypothetical protein
MPRNIRYMHNAHFMNICSSTNPKMLDNRQSLSTDFLFTSQKLSRVILRLVWVSYETQVKCETCTLIIPISACYSSKLCSATTPYSDFANKSWIGCSDIVEHKRLCLIECYILNRYTTHDIQYHLLFEVTNCYISLLFIYDRGESVVSYRWTNWVWELTGWSSRVKENYLLF